jgi:hypothetical protein
LAWLPAPLGTVLDSLLKCAPRAYYCYRLYVWNWKRIVEPSCLIPLIWTIQVWMM